MQFHVESLVDSCDFSFISTDITVMLYTAHNNRTNKLQVNIVMSLLWFWIVRFWDDF